MNGCASAGAAEKSGQPFIREVELLSANMGGMFIGISRPNLDPTGRYYDSDCTDGWFIYAYNGGLCGNGKRGDDDGAGSYKQGDRVAVGCSILKMARSASSRTAYSMGLASQRAASRDQWWQQCKCATRMTVCGCCRMPKHPSAIDMLVWSRMTGSKSVR